MRIRLFAGLAEAVGRRDLELDLPARGAPSTVAELESLLRERWSELGARPFRIAVNRRYARPDDAVSAGDEVALIPPVSGG